MAAELRALTIENDVEDGIIATQCQLTVEEVRVLRESFEFCDADGSGYIDLEELPVVLKNLGCAAITPVQKRALAKTQKHSGGSSNLNLSHMAKFLVQYQEACAKEILLSFKDEEKEGVPVDKLVQALYQIGQYLSRNGAIALLQRCGGDPESKVVDKQVFKKMLEVDRGDKIVAWRKTCGFTDHQLTAIRHAFSTQAGGEEFIPNRDGTLTCGPRSHRQYLVSRFPVACATTREPEDV